MSERASALGYKTAGTPLPVYTDVNGDKVYTCFYSDGRGNLICIEALNQYEKIEQEIRDRNLSINND